MKIYEIYHEYEWVEAYGVRCCDSDRIGFVETEEKAKKYCEMYNNEHVYDNNFGSKCGRLYYREANDYLTDKELSRPPYKNWYEDGVDMASMWFCGSWDKEETK